MLIKRISVTMRGAKLGRQLHTDAIKVPEQKLDSDLMVEE